MEQINFNRIKYFREVINLSQKELADGKLSVNFISMLELGKRKLTATTAAILANNLNKLALDKGIILNLQAKDLLADANMVAEDYCNSEIRRLEHEKFEINNYLELLDTAIKYDVHSMVFKINKIIGENEYISSNYEKAISAFTEALKVTNKVGAPTEIINVFHRLGTCYYMTGQYETAIEVWEKSYRDITPTDCGQEELRGKILFNLALAFNKLKEYDVSLRYLNTALDLKDLGKAEYKKIIMLKANIYQRMLRHEEALSIYKSIPDSEWDYLVYYNVSIIYHSLNREEESFSCLNHSIQLQLEAVSEDTTSSLIQLGELYFGKNMMREAITCIEKALCNSKRFKQVDKQLKCYNLLLNIYIKLGKASQFDLYIKDILNNLELYIHSEYILSDLVLLLFQYIAETTKSEAGLEIINKIKEHRKEV